MITWRKHKKISGSHIIYSAKEEVKVKKVDIGGRQNNKFWFTDKVRNLVEERKKNKKQDIFQIQKQPKVVYLLLGIKS